MRSSRLWPCIVVQHEDLHCLRRRHQSGIYQCYCQGAARWPRSRVPRGQRIARSARPSIETGKCWSKHCHRLGNDDYHHDHYDQRRPNACHNCYAVSCPLPWRQRPSWQHTRPGPGPCDVCPRARWSRGIDYKALDGDCQQDVVSSAFDFEPCSLGC